MLLLQSFLREGRVVGPCWEKLKPKGPKGSFLRKGEVLAYVGRIHNLKDLKDMPKEAGLFLQKKFQCPTMVGV